MSVQCKTIEQHAAMSADVVTASLPLPVPRLPNTRIQGLAWGLSGVVLWSGSFVLTRVGFKSALNPYDLIALRFFFGGLLLLPVIIRQGVALKRLGLLGLVILVAGSGAPYGLLSSTGLQFAPASHAAALIPGPMAAMVALFGSLFLSEKLSRQRWGGVALILFGSVLISGMLTVDGTKMLSQLPGHILFLMAAFVWACYVIVMRRSQLPALHATAIATVLSAIFYLPIYIVALPKGIGHTQWSDIIVQMVYQGALTTVVGLLAFNRAVTLLGAAAASALPALIPVVTLVLGLVFLHEVPGPTDIAAACLIAGGVWVLTGSRRRT